MVAAPGFHVGNPSEYLFQPKAELDGFCLIQTGLALDRFFLCFVLLSSGLHCKMSSQLLRSGFVVWAL
jgi:hypothetical protein